MCTRAVGLGGTVLGLLLAARCSAFAASLPNSEDVPIVGGHAAVARALSLDPAPERARFVAELVRTVYDTPAGKNRETDTKLAVLSKHLELVSRLQASLTAVQPAGRAIALSSAANKAERDRLKAFLDVAGLKLREKNRTFTVEATTDKQAAERVKMLHDLGIDLAQLSGRLNRGESVRIDVPIETVPLPLDAKRWSALLGRTVQTSDLFAAVVSDRRAALLAHGLAALDDETLEYLAGHEAILNRLYEHDAAAFATFGESLHIRGGQVIVPGGPSAVPLWEGVVGERVTTPDRFVGELFGRDEGRIAYVYEVIASLDGPHAAFALNRWMQDPAVRLERFKALTNAPAALKEWVIADRPFQPPPYDVSALLSRIRVRDDGRPSGQTARRFWQSVFDGVDLPDNPAARVKNLDEDGVIDAAWLGEAIFVPDRPRRRDRFHQLVFGQRVFDAPDDRQLADVLIGLRALPRYRTLMLTLDRIGIRNPAVYAAAARQAERLTALDGRNRYVALVQFQGALAALDRLRRVRVISADRASELVESLVKVPIGSDGRYQGRIVAWLSNTLVPAIGGGAEADPTAQLTHALAGGGSGDAPIRRVSWEGGTYRLDVIGAEERRLRAVIDKLKPPSLALMLEIDRIAVAAAKPDASLTEIQGAVASLEAVMRQLPPPARPSAAAVKPVDPPRDPRLTIGSAIQDLTKIARPADVKRASRTSERLLETADDLFTEWLLGIVYALDLGRPDGTVLLAGNVSARHDFGLSARDREDRIRLPWTEARQVAQAGVPWYVSGSLLGLDAGLASLTLERVRSGPPPQTALTVPEREAFARSVARLNPIDLTDVDTDGISTALRRGRSRVDAVRSEAQWSQVSSELFLDGWRRRAGRWIVADGGQTLSSLLSLTDLFHLGSPGSALPVSWGMADDELGVCFYPAMPGQHEVRLALNHSELGLMASVVPDLNLRVADALHELHVPASLGRGVLAMAMQDYIDSVRRTYDDDWLSSVRAAEAVSLDRIIDYVAALTAGGPLTADQ